MPALSCIEGGSITPREIYERSEGCAKIASEQTFTAPQRFQVVQGSNNINFFLGNNFIINATVGIIESNGFYNSLSGQSGYILINDSENITGWDSGFRFLDDPAATEGTVIYSYVNFSGSAFLSFFGAFDDPLELA